MELMQMNYSFMNINIKNYGINANELFNFL